jgi:putative ABC transport system permease protein
MVYLLIAFRNLGRQKRRTILLASAIAFGVFIIMMLNGFTAGIIRNVEQNLAQLSSGHIFISAKEHSASGKELSLIRDDRDVELAITDLSAGERAAIVDVVKRSSFIATLVFGSKTYIQRVEGIDWEKERAFRESLAVVSGSLERISERNTIVLSAPAAKRLGVQVGESILVKLTTVTGQQNVGELTVIALTVDSGLFGGFSAYARLDDVNALLDMEEGDYQQMGSGDRSSGSNPPPNTSWTVISISGSTRPGTTRSPRSHEASIQCG